MNKEKIDHYDKIFDVLDTEATNPDDKLKSIFDFVIMHTEYYTKQWFTVEESYFLMDISNRVKDFFWLDFSLNFHKHYHNWNYESIIELIYNFFNFTDKKYTGDTIEMNFAQLANSFSSKIIQKDNSNFIIQKKIISLLYKISNHNYISKNFSDLSKSEFIKILFDES